MNDDSDSEDEWEKSGGTVSPDASERSQFSQPRWVSGVIAGFESAEEAGGAQPRLFRPVPVCPAIVQPELDIEVRLI